MSFTVVDEDTCECCSNMESPRTLVAVGSLRAAADYLVTHYDNEQLLDGLFDEVVVRRPDAPGTPASRVLQEVGYTKDVLASMAAERREATKRWLNLA